MDPLPLEIPQLPEPKSKPKVKRKRGRPKKPPKPPPVTLSAPTLSDLLPIETPTPAGPSRADIDEIRRIAHEITLRKMQSLRLYEPLPIQAEFHKCKSKVRLLRGSNRAGKTIVAAAEFARIVLGQHEGFPKRDGRAYIVGKDEKHLGEVIYRKLFRPGAFKIIRDEATREWRAFRPWEPRDAERKKEAKPALPLIPAREISSISWNKKVSSIPEKVVLRNGWEIDFFSSLAKPPRGSDLDFVWLDEEIVDSDWVPEMLARLIDRQGRLIWGFTPQSGSDRAFELHQKCDEEFEDWRQSGFSPDREPANREFVILLRDNPHFTEKEKREHASSFSAEEQAIRVDGEYAIEASKIYPEFNVNIHSIPYFDMPDDWTRYAVVDPGRQICAVLFAAVPPPDAEFPSGAVDSSGKPVVIDCTGKSFVFLYDELYIPNCDAVQFGERMARKCVGQAFEAFIIDGHGSRSAEAGSGKTIEQQYRAELEKHGVRSRISGHGFLIGSDDVAGRVEAFRLWLRLAPHGLPKVLCVDVKNRLPNFKWEIERWRYKKTAAGITDQPESRGRTHLMACFDGETEILAESGWCPFPLLPVGERVMTVNLESNEYQYQEPTDYITRRHIGEMIEIDGRCLNAMVTPDHRMIVYPKSKLGRRVEIREAGCLKSTDMIKTTAVWNAADQDRFDMPDTKRSRGCSVDAGDFAELLGWYAAEGWRATNIQMPGRGYLVSICQTKATGVSELKSLFKRMPWKWRSESQSFFTSNHSLWLAVGECGDGAMNKKVPDWIRAASPRIIERFIRGAMLGDGNVWQGNRHYYTSSPRLAGDMQELFMKIGATASVLQRPGGAWKIRGRSGVSKDRFVVVQRNTHQSGLRREDGSVNYRSVDFDGMVYCVSVPNGTLVVRRRGRPMIAGNCVGYLAHHDPQYVPPQKMKARATGAYAMFLEKRRRQREQGATAVMFGPSR